MRDEHSSGERKTEEKHERERENRGKRDKKAGKRSGMGGRKGVKHRIFDVSRSILRFFFVRIIENNAALRPMMRPSGLNKKIINNK